MSEIINNQEPVYKDRRRKGTGFTNTQDVVKSNENNQLGQAVTKNVNKVIDSSQNKLNEDYGKFQDEARKGALVWGDNNQETQNVHNMLNQINTGSSYDVDKNKVNRYLSGSYLGPKQYEVDQKTTNQVSDMKNLVSSSNTESGRQDLLRRSFGNTNNYTQGQNRFDSMLLGKTHQNELTDLTKRARNVGRSVEDINNKAKALVNNYRVKSREFSDRYRGAVNDTTGTYQSNINDRVANKNYGTSAASLAREAYKDQGKVYSGLINKIGMDDGRTYNYNLGNFQDIDATKNTVTTEDELNKLNALANMLGQDQQSFFTVNKDTLGRYNELNNQALLNKLQHQKRLYNEQLGALNRSKSGGLGFGGVTGNYENARNWMNNRSFNMILGTGDYAFDHGGYHGVNGKDISRYANAISQGLKNINKQKERLGNYITSKDQYTNSGNYQALLDKYAKLDNANYNLQNDENVSNPDVDRSILNKVNEHFQYGINGRNDLWKY